jgi:phage FluMu protein Com
MQLRCSHCHRPYALGRDEVNAALDEITNESLAHYNSACPHCRHVNRVSRKDLERAAPNWRKETEEETANG